MAPESPHWTVRRLSEWATADFRARGIDTPKLDAELLISEVLGVSRMQLWIDAERELSANELGQLRALIQRRRTREPLAYLRGFREFYGHNFRVDKRVLVPRPETETLVDVALERSQEVSLSARVLDLCTGSGAVAISLAKARPTSRVLASDLSADALLVAQDNAYRLGAYNVGFARSDLFASLAPVLQRARWPQRFDLITCNPPYIPHAELAELMPEVRDHEPHLALDGGDDGLAFYRRLAQEAPRWLRRGGVIALEIGFGQAAAVSALLQNAGFSALQITPDLARIERVLSARWP